jgi:hypothetical protein
MRHPIGEPCGLLHRPAGERRMDEGCKQAASQEKKEGSNSTSVHQSIDDHYLRRRSENLSSQQSRACLQVMGQICGLMEQSSHSLSAQTPKGDNFITHPPLSHPDSSCWENDRTFIVRLWTPIRHRPAYTTVRMPDCKISLRGASTLAFHNRTEHTM